MKSISLTITVDDEYTLTSVTITDNQLGLKSSHELIVNIANAIVEDDAIKKKNDALINEALNIINSKNKE